MNKSKDDQMQAASQGRPQQEADQGSRHRFGKGGEKGKSDTGQQNDVVKMGVKQQRQERCFAFHFV